MIHHDDDSVTAALATALLSAALVLVSACSGGGGGPGRDPRGDEPGHDEHAGEDDHDGHAVELTEAQVEAAGVRVEPAEAGEISRHLTMPAVVAADADAVTHVNPKAAGIVRSIHKHLGEEVEEGDLLCVIDSIELGRSVADFVRASALVGAAETTLEREARLFEERISIAERVLQGAIDVDERIYEREKELQERAVSTIRPLLEADKALKGSRLAKERELTDLRAERDARLLALEIDLAERRIARSSARNVLFALGLRPAVLEDLGPGSPLVAGTYEIRAPRGGIVSGRHITTGEFVDGATKLYTLEDLSRVWVLASAFEEQLQSVRTGRKGHVHLDSFPERVFEGRVTQIGYEVDPESRAVRVRFELENPTLPDWPEEYPIRPGMFGRVDLLVETIQARVVLPESAIVHADEGDFVFVRTAPGAFERRPVDVGPPTGDLVEVRRGLEPGEMVAVAGTFQLKSALRRGELGAGHGH